MPHIVEQASSGRAKCRGCGQAIGKGELRFGERLPNPFADSGDMTLWFHIPCAAYKRPESLAEIIDDIPDNDLYKAAIAAATGHPRLVRINGLEQAPSGRSRCRACKEMIAKDEWRIPLVFFEEGMFNASGSVHVTCAVGYFGTADVLERLAFFGDVTEDDLKAVAALLESA